MHEDFLRRLMDTSRKIAELEEQLGGGSHPSAADEECALLVVEDDGWLGKQLESALQVRGGYVARHRHHRRRGARPRHRPHLPDRARARLAARSPRLDGGLDAEVAVAPTRSPSSIRARTACSRARPTSSKARKTIPLVPEFSDGKQMVERIDELREAFRRKSRERRYLAAFRQENYELLRRYADLKQRLQRAAK